jgi:hypothetical protein
VDFGGPQVLSLGEVVQQYQDDRGVRRRIRPVSLPKAAVRVADPLVCPNGRRGQTTWSMWLSRQVNAEPARSKGRRASTQVIGRGQSMIGKGGSGKALSFAPHVAPI